VAEEFESSIEIFNRVLRHYHVPRNVVAAQERLLRGEKYEALRAPTPGVSPERVMRLLAAGTTDVYQVEPGGAADGRTIAEVNLRRRTGASIIAVVRGDTSHPNPPADLLLQPGDALVLVGSHAEIERAFAALGG
jgi:CPA2 family monovalent cation:H+ antiporter-2